MFSPSHGSVSTFVQGVAPKISLRYPPARYKSVDSSIALSRRSSLLCKVYTPGMLRQNQSLTNLHSLALSLNVDKSFTETLDLDKKINVLDKSKLCLPSGLTPARKIGLKVDAETQAHVDVNYGVVSNGSIVPPKVDNFCIFADFDAALDGILDIGAYASITLDSGKLNGFPDRPSWLEFPWVSLRLHLAWNAILIQCTATAF